MGCGSPIPGKVAGAAFGWKNMGAVTWQAGLPLGGEVTFFLSSTASGVWQFPKAQWNCTEICGSLTQFVVIWVCLIKTSESHISLPTYLHKHNPILFLGFEPYILRLCLCFLLFYQTSCGSHSLHNYLGFNENGCVSACNQKWLSLLVHVKYRYTKFLWLWQFIPHAGWERHHTEPHRWQSTDKQPSCSCFHGG